MAAKRSEALPLLASALCLLSLFGLAHCGDFLYVEGKVYCDTCRIGFETQVSEYLPGAQVKVECRDREGGQVKYSVEGKTDKDGKYKVKVKGEHEEEVCEVVLLDSARPDCTELLAGRDRARVLLTSNNGIADTSRYANSLAFLKKEPIAACPEVLRKVGLLPSAMMP